MSFEESAAGILDRYRTDIAAQASGQLAEVREAHARELAAAVEAARIEREARDKEFHENLARTQEEALRQYEEALQQKSEAWANEAAEKLAQNGQIAVASLSRVGEQALRGSFLKMFEQIADAIRHNLAEPAGSETDAKAMGASASGSSSTPPPMMNPGGAGHDSHAGM
jgi:ribosomal protein L16 Arg81 hydroxylase